MTTIKNQLNSSSVFESLFIATVENLGIEEDLGEGFEIWNGIRLTNNPEVIKSLMTSQLVDALGHLETSSILNSDAVFYSIFNEDITEENKDKIVCNYIAYCKMFLTDLWMIKDHCSDIMIGFIHWKVLVKNEKSSQEYALVSTHSNSITSGYTDSKGNGHKKRSFSLKELDIALSFHEDGTRELIAFDESVVKATLIKKGTPRFTLANLFLQTARVQGDLGIKISHYCTAFETLFSTNSFELTHKLAERLACFLSNEPSKRMELFNSIKTIYGLRSSVVHGSSIKKSYEHVIEFSQLADQLLREVLTKINATPELDQFYRIVGKDDKFLEDYMNGIVLGVNKI
jgi:hypothetical protein